MANNPVSGLIGSLPIEHMVAAPILAALKAHVAATQAFADFFTDVCMYKDGGVKMIRFLYEQTEMDDAGNPTGKVNKRAIDMPFFAAIPLPAMGVDKVNIKFELEINTIEENKSKTETSIAVDVKYGFGPWGVKVQGKLSHARENTRKTDTRSKYSFEIEASRQEPPEALMRVIDAILEVAKAVPAESAPKLPEPAPAPTGG